MASESSDGVLDSWSSFFHEILRLLEEGERQLDVANVSYIAYMLERLELSISTCSEVLHHIRNQAGLEECESQLRNLIDSIKCIYQKWEEYRSIFDSNLGSCSYQASISPRAVLGRPKFLISKDQLEYLSSLGFKWKEIAVLIGVSRMTVYRYV